MVHNGSQKTQRPKQPITLPLLLPLLTGLAFLPACADPGPGDSPVDLPAFAPVVADLHVAEAMSIEVPIQVRDSITEAYFDRTLADHGMERAEFDSLSWIVRREPEWVDSLYTIVGDLLAEREAARR